MAQTGCWKWCQSGFQQVTQGTVSGLVGRFNEGTTYRGVGCVRDPPKTGEESMNQQEQKAVITLDLQGQCFQNPENRGCVRGRMAVAVAVHNSTASPKTEVAGKEEAKENKCN